MIERNFLTPNEVAGELVTVAENKDKPKYRCSWTGCT